MLDACGDDTHKKKGVEARRLDHLIADARLNLRLHDEDQLLASGMLFVLGSAHALACGILFAHIRPGLRLSVLFMAGEVIDL